MHIKLADSGGLSGLFSALGLNWESFLLNMAAFLVTAYVIGKWVYPPLSRALEAKKDELEAAVRLEKEAGTKLDEAKLEAAQIVRAARGQADDILAMTKEQASAQMDEAKSKAQAAADRTAADAREQLARDVREAREELKSDTAKLVVSATEAVLGEKLTDKEETALVSRTLRRHSS